MERVWIDKMVFIIFRGLEPIIGRLTAMETWRSRLDKVEVPNQKQEINLYV